MSVTLYSALEFLTMLSHAIGFAGLLLLGLVIGYNLGCWAANKFRGKDDESEQ